MTKDQKRIAFIERLGVEVHPPSNPVFDKADGKCYWFAETRDTWSDPPFWGCTGRTWRDAVDEAMKEHKRMERERKENVRRRSGDD